MATIIASAMDVAAAHCSTEETLLDAYDLQWKAIDIRLEKLRNECERMILEYEVEVKQKMYLRECEDLMRQTQVQHDAQQAEMERALAEKDDRLNAAEVDAQQRKRSSEEALRKANAGDQRTVKDKAKKLPVKRKNEQPVKATIDVEDEESIEEKVIAPKPKAAKKPAEKKKLAIEKPVPRPVSPPVYVPEEEAAEERFTAEEPPSPTVEPAVPEVDLSRMVDDDVLGMLSEESEDFGDTSSVSLIHPKSPALLSPKRLKKAAAFEAAALAKNASSPLRGGPASLADRIMNRVRTVSKQPLAEPEPLSDASNSPPPMLGTPLAKRALKRRKIAVLSSAMNQSAAAVQAKVAEKLAAATKEIEAEVRTQKVQAQNKTDSEIVERTKTQTKRNITHKADVSGGAESEADDPTKESELEAGERTKSKNSIAASKPATNEANKPAARPRKSKKETRIMDADERPETMHVEQIGEHDDNTEQDHQDSPVKSTKNKGRQAGAVTGRSKARQTAKLAALRAAAVEEDDVAGFPDIKTPKVPRKKMGMDGKKKQINDLAAKRAEFQQILSESAPNDDVDNASKQSAATKKRRRQDEAVKRKEPAELEFHTPKPKAKKPKISRNPFPNDELNIMKSPVPLLRAKIAEKKKAEQEAKKTTNKRTASERDGIDEEDPGYGTSAVAVQASSVLPSTMRSPASSVKPAISFPSSKKGPEDLAAAASDYASRWINSGLVTRAKKNAVKATRKPATKSPKPASLWGGGASFFDAFVNTTAPAIPRLKPTSSVPKG